MKKIQNRTGDGYTEVDARQQLGKKNTKYRKTPKDLEREEKSKELMKLRKKESKWRSKQEI